MILAIGTSHTADRNGDVPYYANPDNGDQTWPEYLGEQIGQQVINLGISAIGIDTYFARIISALEAYPETQTMLVEIPSPHRFEFPLNNKIYNWGDFIDIDYWYNSPGAPYYDTLIRYGGGDVQMLKKKELLSKMWKFTKPNDNAEIKLKLNDIITMIQSLLKMNNKYISDQVLVKINFIDGYLKQKNIRPIFWTMDQINIKAYENRRPVLLDNLELMNKMSMTELAYLKGWRQDNKESYADGAHLNSDKWRKMVDKYFVPYFKENVCG